MTAFSTRLDEPSFAAWERTFLEAIEKRASHGAWRPAVFPSSGYDSSAISLALNRLGVEYESPADFVRLASDLPHLDFILLGPDLSSETMSRDWQVDTLQPALSRPRHPR